MIRNILSVNSYQELKHHYPEVNQENLISEPTFIFMHTHAHEVPNERTVEQRVGPREGEYELDDDVNWVDKYTIRALDYLVCKAAQSTNDAVFNELIRMERSEIELPIPEFARLLDADQFGTAMKIYDSGFFSSSSLIQACQEPFKEAISLNNVEKAYRIIRTVNSTEFFTDAEWIELLNDSLIHCDVKTNQVLMEFISGIEESDLATLYQKAEEQDALVFYLGRKFGVPDSCFELVVGVLEKNLELLGPDDQVPGKLATVYETIFSNALYSIAKHSVEEARIFMQNYNYDFSIHSHALFGRGFKENNARIMQNILDLFPDQKISSEELLNLFRSGPSNSVDTVAIIFNCMEELPPKKLVKDFARAAGFMDNTPLKDFVIQEIFPNYPQEDFIKHSSCPIS